MDPVRSEVTIRDLRADDIDAIAEIYSLITKKAVDAALKELIESHLLKKEYKAPFVAEIRSSVVGFLISYIVTLGFGAKKSAYIATMGVHPRYMGQGVGTGMAREVFRFYKSQGITRVYTSVGWDSTDILSFFKTMDFERSDFINLAKDLDQQSETVVRERRDCY